MPDSDRVSSVFWRRLDRPGHEWARLEPAGDGGWHLYGVALFAHEEEACRLDYDIACDAGWRTRAAHVQGFVGARRIERRIAAEPRGEWTLDGRPVAAVSGCVDVDLNFSPSTNLLPIRRLALSPGAGGTVRAAWLRFPSFALEPLEQSYTHLRPGVYLYESAGGAFRRELEVDARGFVIHYPGFFRVEGLGR
jgi:hypothetical protein